MYSFSAGIVPASVPGAALLGAILWWVPFSDVGQNRAHVLSIRDHLRDKGIGCEVERLGRGGKSVAPRAEKEPQG